MKTTAPTDNCLDTENRRMFTVSYVITFAFHPELQLNRIIIERSFEHLQARLCSLDYLTNEQFKNLTMLKRTYCALSVATGKRNIAISEMFAISLKFAGDCLMKWFKAKFKSQNIVLSNDAKKKYEIENPINWQTERCCLCTFPIEINPTVPEVTKDNMSYSDFVIRKEHKFLRNIFSEEELSTSNALKDFKTYPEKFSKFLCIAIYLQNCLNTT